MSIDYEIVSDHVRKARQMRSYTSDQLSEMVDFAPESLRHIENGSSKPSLRKLYALAEALNVSKGGSYFSIYKVSFLCYKLESGFYHNYIYRKGDKHGKD